MILMDKVGDWILFEKKGFIDIDGYIKELGQSTIIYKLGEYWGVRYFENIFNVYTNRSHNTLVDYNGNVLKTFDKQNFYEILSLEELIYYDRIKEGTFYNNNFICNSKLLEHYLYDNFLFFYNRKGISLYIIDYGIKWNYNFAFPQYYDVGFCRYDDVELEQFIGMFNNELWILFSGNRILVLDIETGKEVYQYESLETTLETSFSIKSCFVDEQKGIVKVLAYKYYIEIDMVSKKSQIKKDFGGLSVGGFSVVDGSYYGDQYIYFVGRKYNSEKFSIGNNLAGVFNTSTLEIEWMYELEVKEKNHFFVGVPQANDKYFGVKDSESSLFLFERDEMMK